MVNQTLASPKNKKPKQGQATIISYLNRYKEKGCTLCALIEVLSDGIANKEKGLTENFKKHIFQAVGLDSYRICLQGEAQLTLMLKLSLAIARKKADKAEDWLKILKPCDDNNAQERISKEQLKKLNDAVAAYLATHIPKARHPDNTGAPKFTKPKVNDLSSIASSEATLVVMATITGNAAAVGTGFFFGFVFYLDGDPSSVMDLLFNNDERLTRSLIKIGLKDATILKWQDTIKQLPTQLSPLHAQLLFKDENNEGFAITPMLSVAAASWLGQWRKETFFDSNSDNIPIDGTRPRFDFESVAYGGTNTRNIASILMDFSGKLNHPTVFPPPIKDEAINRLERLIYYPKSLIKPKALRDRDFKNLINPYHDFPNHQRQQKLNQVISALLDEMLKDIVQLRNIIYSTESAAQPIQAAFEAQKNTHSYLRFIQDHVDADDISYISDVIIEKWLGSFTTFKGGGERYNQIKWLVKAQLQTYMTQKDDL